MNLKENKKFLIDKVNELSNDKEFWENMMNDRRGGREGKLGSTNIRSVATVCENADCFEELKLYIEYKIAKGNGWEEKIKINDKYGEVFGQVVLRHMNEIYEKCEKNDNEALKMIGLYFGYLFWRKAAIEKGDYLNSEAYKTRNNKAVK